MMIFCFSLYTTQLIFVAFSLLVVVVVVINML